MKWDALLDLRLTRERHSRGLTSEASGWSPLTDLVETDEAYTLVAELPGFRLDDVQVSATDQGITLRGERRPVPTPASFLRLEREYGPFTREFRFPQPVDVDAITADLRDGVLTIRLPKNAAPDDPGRVHID